MKAGDISFIWLLCFLYSASLQAQFADSCFISTNAGTSFSSSNNLQNVNNADLLQWTGSSWTGTWPAANITLPPPAGSNACRAIWIGDATVWTTGGESFGMRLVQSLVPFNSYSYTFTYVSHGMGSYGNFSPFIYTNSSPTLSGAYSLGQLPGVGTSWTSNTYTFTAASAQAGHSWFIISSEGNSTSGMFINFCTSCATSVQTCSVHIGNDTALCPGQVLNLDATTSGSSYLWSTGSTQSSIPVNAAGSYWVEVNQAGCIARDTILISYLFPQSTSFLGNDTGICSNDTLLLDVASSGVSYLWQDNSNASDYTVTQSGTYSATVVDSAGCTIVDSILITEDTVFFTTHSTNTACGNSNGSVVLHVTGGILPFIFDWNNGQHNDTISNLGSGTYSVTVTDSLGCSASGSAVVNTSNAIGVSITEDKAVICASDSVRICATAGYPAYLWNIGTTDSCVVVNNAGNYYVTVTDINGCSAESNHLAVSVYPLPPVSISVNGDTLTAYDAVTYQWYRNGSAINNATSNIYIAQQGGNYTVAVTDTNGCGAISTAVIISGIDNLTGEDAVNIFPNPLTVGSWQLTVGSNMIGSTVEIFDADGRNVFKSEIRNPKSEIATNVAKGVYLLHINSARSSVVRKLVKL